MKLALDQVHNVDCLKGLEAIKPGSVDLVFADPPFNIGYDYDEYDDDRDADSYLNWSRQWMTGVVKALKPTGTFWLAIGDEYAAELKLIAQRELGLTCRSWVVWYYTFGVNCTKKFNRSHAHLFHFVKDTKQYTFNAKAIRIPSARQLVYNDSRSNPDGKLPDDTWVLRPQDLAIGFKPDEDTWYFPRVAGTFKERAGWHGCQMPEQLLGRILRACSDPGDLVLDPFGGSGTTLAVAKKLGRQWLGFELSKRYAKRIEERLALIKPRDRLEGADEPLISAPATPSRSQVGRSGFAKGGTARFAQRPAKRTIVVGRTSSKLNGDAPLVIQAYLAAGAGYSIDRVALADPGLNLEFLRACKDVGLPGEAVELNRQLVSLRKAGKLSSLPQPRRTIVRRKEMDEYLFASEIAWRLVADRWNVSLDGILCRPEYAREFDDTAGRFAPGWSPFHYRWGALHLRKEASKKRKYAATLPRQAKSLIFPKADRAWDDHSGLEDAPGLYLIKLRGQDTSLYLGETERMQTRMKRQASLLDSKAGLLAALNLRNVDSGDVRVGVLPIRDSALQYRLGLQSWLLTRLESAPLANVGLQTRSA